MLLLTGAILLCLLWGASIWLWATGMFPWLCMALYLLHLLVFFLAARPMGERYGDPVIKTALFTMLFGYLYVLWRRKRAAQQQLHAEDGAEPASEPAAEPEEPSLSPGSPAQPESPAEEAEPAPAAEPEEPSLSPGSPAQPESPAEEAEPAPAAAEGTETIFEENKKEDEQHDN